MIHSIRQANLPRPESLRWLGLAILGRATHYLCLLILSNPLHGETRLFFVSGDEPGYAISTENLWAVGRYTTDLATPMAQVYRMPGYALFLLPHLAAFGRHFGEFSAVATQVALGGAAVWWTARLTYLVSNSVTAFLLAFLLSVLPSMHSVLDANVLPDSPAASLLVLTVWLLSQFGRGGSERSLWLAGGLAAWAFFMRPFLGLTLGILAAYVCLAARQRTRRFRHSLRPLMIFLALPLVTEVAWISRNWIALRVFMPFHTAGIYLPRAEDAVRRWIMSFGGDFVYWRPGTAAAWLRADSVFFGDPYAPPAPVFSETCPRSQVGLARKKYLEYQAADGFAKSALAHEVTELFDTCRNAYESTHPFDHQLVARVRLLRSFLVHAGPVLPFPAWRDLGLLSPAFLYKMLAVGAYAVTLVLAVFGVASLCRIGDRESYLLAVLVVASIAPFPLLLRMVQTRYLTAGYPFFVASAAIAAAAILLRFSKVDAQQG